MGKSAYWRTPEKLPKNCTLSTKINEKLVSARKELVKAASFHHNEKRGGKEGGGRKKEGKEGSEGRRSGPTAR